MDAPALPPGPLTARPPAHLRDELGALLRLAGPLVGANLLQMAVYAVDVMFVARLGAEALAASALGVAIHGTFMWALTGLTGAAAPLVAAELGRRRHAVREVRRTLRMAFWLAAGAGAVMMVACAFTGPILRATGQQPALAARSAAFMGVLLWATIPTLFAAVLRVFVAALGRPGIATAITFCALIANIAGNWILVFGNLGAPALGLEGSALSSVIVSVVVLAIYLVAIARDRQLRRYHLFGHWWRAEWSRLADLIRVGVPIMFIILAEGGLFNSAAFVMGLIGENELAGHTVALQVAALAFQVPFGIAQAATIRVGMGYGAGNRRWITLAGRAAIGTGIGFMALTAAAIWLFPRAIVSLYIDVSAPENAAMTGFAVQFLVIAAAFQLFDGAQAVAAGSLRGLQDTRMPMVIAILGYWGVGFVLTILLGLHTPLAGLGIWMGLAAGLVVVATLLITRWFRRDALGLGSPAKVRAAHLDDR